MELGIFLRVFFSKTAKRNALNAKATTQEVKYQHSHVSNPSSSVAVRGRPPCAPMYGLDSTMLGRLG